MAGSFLDPDLLPLGALEFFVVLFRSHVVLVLSVGVTCYVVTCCASPLCRLLPETSSSSQAQSSRTDRLPRSLRHPGKETSSAIRPPSPSPFPFTTVLHETSEEPTEVPSSRKGAREQREKTQMRREKGKFQFGAAVGVYA